MPNGLYGVLRSTGRELQSTIHMSKVSWTEQRIFAPLFFSISARPRQTVAESCDEAREPGGELAPVRVRCTNPTGVSSWGGRSHYPCSFDVRSSCSCLIARSRTAVPAVGRLQGTNKEGAKDANYPGTSHESLQGIALDTCKALT